MGNKLLKSVSVFLSLVILFSVPVITVNGNDTIDEEYLSILEKYRLVNSESIKHGDIYNENITIEECLEMFARLYYLYPDENIFTDDWIRGWEGVCWDTLVNNEGLDDSFQNLSDKDKVILRILYNDSHIILGEYQRYVYGEETSIETVPSEWNNIKMNDFCTEGQAVLYLVRRVTDYGSCLITTEDFSYTLDESYKAALEKGILDSDDTADSEKPITKASFYKLFYKMLNVEFWLGGYSVRRCKLIDDIENAYIELYTTPKPETGKLVDINMSEYNEAAESDIISVFNSDSPIDRWNDYGLVNNDLSECKNLLITRDEFAHILSNVMGYESYSSITQFVDLTDTHNDMRKLIYAGVMKGYHINSFYDLAMPDVPVTPEEAYVMLARAFYIDESFDNQIYDSNFSDWSKPYVSSMIKLGYLNNDDLEKSQFTYMDLFSILDRIVPVYLNKQLKYNNLPNNKIDNVVLNASGAAVENININGNLYITERALTECIELRNINVSGTIYILGDYNDILCFTNCSASSVKYKYYTNMRDGSGKAYFRNTDSSKFVLDTPSSPKINDDMSISWTMPQNMLGIDGTKISVYAENGLKVSKTIGSLKSSISIKEVIEAAVKAFPSQLSYIELKYTSQGQNVSEAPCLKIDVSNIISIEEGRPVKSGILSSENNERKIIISDGQDFVFGEWYCICRYSERSNDYCAFIADNNTNEIIVNNLSGYLGGGNMDNVFLRKIEYTKDSKGNFILKMTPLDDEPFINQQ